jgi:hypothetical protein
VAGGDLAGGKRTAADLGAWLCFEDESGQGLRPPKGRTWGRPGPHPCRAGDRPQQPAPVTGRADRHQPPGHRPRLIYRTHIGRRHRAGRRKGFTEPGYARLLDATHQQPGGPLVAAWDNLNAHLSRSMADPTATRNWLTICQLPPYATKSTEAVGSPALKGSCASARSRPGQAAVISR